MNGEINFHNEDSEYALPDSGQVAHWVRQCIEDEGFTNGDINVIFCSDPYLHSLNKQYLDHDTFTDIITFDYTEAEELSGDIYISTDRTKENAEEFNTSHHDETQRVIIHGVLHLIGYKDKSAEEQRQMREKEDYYLSLRPPVK